ncbi:MAG: PEP-CTERM sorting domain-containing protein [Pirellulaceae bacterium]
MIDTFSAGSALDQFGAGTNSQTTIDISILGGERDEILTVPDLSGAEFFGMLGFNTQLAIAQGNSDEINGSLTYDNFSGFDMTQGGSNAAFQFYVTGNDADFVLANALSITVHSGLAHATASVPIPASSSLPGNVLVPFSAFGGVDMTQLDSVQLGFDFAGMPGRDIDIGFFAATVPEPASAAILPLVLTSLALRRRRHPSAA